MPSQKSGRILVSLGGTDSANLSVPIVRALVEAGESVAVNERFRDRLGRPGNDASKPQKIEFFAPNIFLETLASADLAVLGAGTSLWEANVLRTPTIGVIVADNQVNPALTGFSQGYVDQVVGPLGARSRASAISEIVAAASHLRQEPARHVTRQVGTDGADLVARILLAEFSKQSTNAR